MNTAINRYEIEFLVKANTWEEVVQIFKAQLKINKDKQDSSVRNMSGLFMIKVTLTEDQMDKDFYDIIRSSSDIAIVSSPICSRERSAILDESYKVETKLRKLLIHISDIAEEYYKHFLKSSYTKDFVKKQSAISTDKLDPITSHLTFGDMLDILKIDLSWSNRTLTVQDVLYLLEDQPDLKGVRSKLKKKLNSTLVWDLISKYVLKKQITWGEINEDLYRLKSLRDKAAHFQIVTETDSLEAKKLATKIINKIEQKRISTSDLEKLRAATYPQFAEALYGARQLAEAISQQQKAAIAAFESVKPQVFAAQSLAAESLANFQALNNALNPNLSDTNATTEETR